MYQAVRHDPSSQYTPSHYSSASRSTIDLREDVESNYFLPSEEGQTRLTYKPPAIRLPFLLFYFAIFASCVGLIEWILDKTEKPILTDSSSLPSSASSATLSKRYVSSCQSNDVYSTQLQNQLSTSSSLCAAYSTTYLPYNRSLPAALQTAFPTWQSLISMNQESRTDLSEALTQCGGRTQTSAADGKLTTVVYAACTSSTMTYPDDGCWGYGSFNLVNGTSISVGWIAVCAESTTAQMIITSQSLTPSTSARITLTSQTPISQMTQPSAKLTITSQSASQLTITSQKVPVPYATSTSASQLTITSQSVTGAPSPNSQLTITSQTAPVPTVVDTASQLTLTSQKTPVTSAQLSITSQPLPSAPAPSSQLTITSQESLVASLASSIASAYLSITSQPLTSSASAPSQITITSQSLSASPARTSAFTLTSQQASQLTITSQNTITTIGTTIGATTATAQLTMTSQTAGRVSQIPPSAQLTVTSQKTTSPSLPATASTAVTPYSTLLPGQTYIYTYTSTRIFSGSIVQTTVVTLYSTYSATSWTTATSVVTDTISPAPTLAEASTPILAATSAASPTSASNNSAYFIHVPYESYDVVVTSTFTTISYFAALFLPAILAVIVKAIWEIIAASLKMIEPFERLEDRGGVSAQYSILSQYLSSIVSLDALRAIGHGRLLPLWTLTTYFLVTIGAPIASISMSIAVSEKCVIDGILRPCNPVWIIHSPVIRVVEGVIIICMVLLVFFMWSTRKAQIAVATNPSSIASVASLMNYRSLVRDFERIDPSANSAEFAQALEQHLFRLDVHQTRHKAFWRYGIIGAKQKNVQMADQFEGAWLRGTGLSADTAYMPVNDNRSQYTNRPSSQPVKPYLRDRKYTPLATDIIHLCTTMTLFALLLGYYLDSNSDPLNNFFNSGKILPKFILVGIATIVDIQTKNLERVIRTTEPYRRLAQRNAKPETTILLPLNGTCWSNLPQCFYLLFRFEFAQGRMLWQTIVSVVTALSDFNIIAVAGVPFESAQTTPGFLACAYISLGVTSCVLLVILVTMIWWRRSEAIREMPRQPDTIGTIMSYLCSSELVREWMDSRTVRAEELRTDYMGMLVRGEGRRYFFGKVPCMDGRERWCVDIDSWRDEKEARARADVWMYT